MMYERSFVATIVALGGTVDDALAALVDPGPTSMVSPDVRDLALGLRAPQRATRAARLATAVRDIVLAIDEATLR